MRIVVVLLAFLLVCGAPAAQAETPEQFFQRFIEMGQRFDPAVTELYVDGASIRMYRRYPHGLERSMEMSGAEWKALLRKMMPLAQAKNDKSIYTDVKVSSSDTKVKISANRYAARKCYTDRGYYLVIEKQPNGGYGVIEEYFETEPKPDCQ